MNRPDLSHIKNQVHGIAGFRLRNRFSGNNTTGATLSFLIRETAFSGSDLLEYLNEYCEHYCFERVTDRGEPVFSMDMDHGSEPIGIDLVLSLQRTADPAPAHLCLPHTLRYTVNPFVHHGAVLPWMNISLVGRIRPG